MTTVINVRGTSGSGKSHPVHQLLALSESTEEQISPDGRVKAHWMSLDGRQIYAIGSYRRVCGGTDTIKTQDEICNLVRFYSEYGDVIVEGLLMSHLYSRYTALADELSSNGHHFIWAYINTPIEVCINRVLARRRERAEARGKEMKPLNPQNTVKHFFSTWKTYKKAKRDGYDTRIIDWESDPAGQLIAMLNLGDSDYVR